MNISTEQVKLILANKYGCCVKDIHFTLSSVGYYNLPDPLPFSDEPEEGHALTLITGEAIFQGIKREEKELKELYEALQELEDEHRGGRAWDVITSERITQEKKVRELKNREYTY